MERTQSNIVQPKSNLLRLQPLIIKTNTGSLSSLKPASADILTLCQKSGDIPTSKCFGFPENTKCNIV